MLIRHPADILSSEITDQALFRRRREFLRGGAALALGLHAAGSIAAVDQPSAAFGTLAHSPFSTDEPLTPLKDVTHYNNFYEFSTDKEQPAVLAEDFKTRPWSVVIEGEVAKPGPLNIEDIIKRFPPEDRIYRMRCVEAWSMVIPWVGFPLGALLKSAEPTSRAKYVAFQTLLDPQQMPGQKSGLFGSTLDWPYREGLRMDEAMNPLAILAVGLYGELLPNQNGAPIRLVVPWKYGFKGIKSIVKIKLLEKQPLNTWNEQAPGEYGFYANVNPQVDHPRWSQARERRIGDWTKRPTLMFNGYGDQVASLYAGMDLRKNF